MPLKNLGAITLFVEDLQRSKRFYEAVFDLQAIYEDENSTAFDFGNTIINLLTVPAARGLIEPGTVGSSSDGSRFQLSVWVDDTDAVCAHLNALGIALLNGPMNRPWGKRTATFTDPDGTIWEVAQQLT
jgi:catechol 2,3-dioxygenase-like lactoylglutathione lyase family enzyme